MATDRFGNTIIKGNYNVPYQVFDFSDYPQVFNSVSKSETTESVYITYSNSENNNRISVRFSTHINNAVEFGDQLDGDFATAYEILYHLGLKKRTFVPKKRLYIRANCIKRKLLNDYDEAELTMTEMYALGVGADITKFIGKRTKGGSWLILGEKVEELIETRKNRLGQLLQVGEYIYHD